MKKGIILLSVEECSLLDIIKENNQNKIAPIDYVIATSSPELIDTIYAQNLGCRIFYVPNFSAVKKLVKQLKIDIVVFDGFDARDVSIEEAMVLKKQKVSYFPLFAEFPGFYGKLKAKRLKIFRNEPYQC
ncbi:MAG: hypothetical protein ACK5N8_07970 [Alphaproteobacteria bacterium]